MADIIELGLFVYALLGSASIGYWVLTSFWPPVHEKERNLKIGISVVVGIGLVLAVFVGANFLSAAHFEGWSFVQAFLALLALLIWIIAIVVLVRQSWEFIQQVSRGEVALFGTKPQALPVITPMPQAELSDLKIEKPVFPKTVPATEPAEPQDIPSFQPEPEPATSAGETEKDVVAEIKKIMSAGREKTETETREPITDKPAESAGSIASKPGGGLTQEEIDKIKRELRKKIEESQN